MGRRSTIYGAIVAVALLLWLGWAILVLTFRGGWVPVFGAVSGELEKAGQFGDSFGALASLMATLAAASAVVAFIAQQREFSKQEFERNFFTLLSNFQQIVREIDIVQMRYDLPYQEIMEDEVNRGIYSRQPDDLFGDTRIVISGRDALRALTVILRNEIKNSHMFRDSKNISKIYVSFYNSWHDDLGHYFRTLYHIFNMIENRCPGDKLHYVRIARAHLSNSELCLLAYNCLSGEGREKFASLLERFSILHNLHHVDLEPFLVAELSMFQRKLPENCFKFDKVQPYKY